MSILRNGPFDADWSEEKSHRCFVIIPGSPASSYFKDVDNIFVPPGWTGFFYHDNDYAQPEGRDARATDPDRMRSGKGYLLFTFHRRHKCGLYQQVPIKPGTVVRFSAWPHAWSNHQEDNSGEPTEDFPHPNDPEWSEGAGYAHVGWRTDNLSTGGGPQEDAKLNFRFDVGIDPKGGHDPEADSVVWCDGWSIYNGFIKQLSVEATAETETITVFIRSETLWPFKHNDAYWDDAELEIVYEPGRGKPRQQYVRTYVLIPPQYGASWGKAAINGTWLKGNFYTIGKSADDAGIGDLDARRIVAVNPHKWNGDLAEFYAKYYPGVDARQVFASDPAELRTILETTPFEQLEKLGGGGGNGNGDEPQHPAPKEIQSWHRQTNITSLDKYPEGMPVENLKLVLGAEDALRYMNAGYKTVDIRYIVDHQGQYIQAMDVAGFLRNFEDSVEQTIKTVTNVYPNAIIYLETTNEEDPNSEQVLEFEIRCSHEIYKRWHPVVRAVLLNIAVGNGEGKKLLPLAKVAYANQHLIGYHCYNPVDPVNAERWLVEEAKWYHLRNLYYIDPVFRAEGVYPLYGLTEGGPVRAISQNMLEALLSRVWAKFKGETITGPRVKRFDPEWLEAKRLYNANPTSVLRSQRVVEEVQRNFPMLAPSVGPLDPGGGWRHPYALNGDLKRTIALELQKRQLILDWNKEHGNRVRFYNQFTIGHGVGWKWFLWEDPEVFAMKDALLAL